jgi:hypothetical protein
MKMIMNEYRLNLGTTKRRNFLLKQMEESSLEKVRLFPPGYLPQGRRIEGDWQVTPLWGSKKITAHLRPTTTIELGR